jgi:exodeoxyribonuclease VII large subunit
MGRLPFDPTRTAAARAAAARGPVSSVAGTDSHSGNAGGIAVSELASLIQGVLRDHLPARLRVVGEVSNFKDQTHWYFTLKDAQASVGCVMWASSAARARFRPQDGQQVVVTGRVEFWPRAGKTQIYADAIEPVGVGALDLEFRRLCEELRALGWFAEERKRPLPRFPRRVAVVTSRTGAALQDVLDTMRRRCPAVAVALVDVRVQGADAAAEVAGALRWLARVHAREGIDAVLVTRGGGSREDLWTFNDREVARAIVESPIPVVAAIGHETDTTIAELVADVRAATPTQAAMRLTPDTAALQEQVDGLAARLSASMARAARHERERLRLVARHPLFTDPRAAVADAGADVADLVRRLRASAVARLAAAGARVERADARLARHRPAAEYARRAADVARLSVLLRSTIQGCIRRSDAEPVAVALGRAATARLGRFGLRLDAAARSLELVGPLAVLRRGFSCTHREDGSIVRSIADVAPGASIRTRVADGTFGSIVVGDGRVGREGMSVGSEAGRPAPPRRGRAPAANDDPGQPGLFERPESGP